MMKTLLTAAALVVAITTSAVAETYNYACQVKDERDNVHLYAAKIDTKARTLTWRGTVFANLKGGDDCGAKYCFEATRRDLTVTVHTATQGAATLQVIGTKTGSDGILEDADCDLVRNK